MIGFGIARLESRRRGAHNGVDGFNHSQFVAPHGSPHSNIHYDRECVGRLVVLVDEFTDLDVSVN
jgi:hypothetical protein